MLDNCVPPFNPITDSKFQMIKSVFSFSLASKMALAIDADCECADDSIMAYLRASTYGKVAKFTMQVGQVDKATEAFNKAVALCDCSGCGC